MLTRLLQANIRPNRPSYQQPFADFSLLATHHFRQLSWIMQMPFEMQHFIFEQNRTPLHMYVFMCICVAVCVSKPIRVPTSRSLLDWLGLKHGPRSNIQWANSTPLKVNQTDQNLSYNIIGTDSPIDRCSGWTQKLNIPLFVCLTGKVKRYGWNNLQTTHSKLKLID